MRARDGIWATWVVAVITLGVLAFFPQTVLAHCDTLDGPVVMAAKQALEARDVTPVLKWVQEDDESEIRGAFKKTLVVRIQSEDARELADMYFFETLVRVHRAGEGAPYTGLKPAGTDPEPVVTASDEALEDDSVDALVKMVTEDVENGIRKRFAHASQARKHANETVEAGREFVKAYVEFVHYAEGLYEAAGSVHAHGDEREPVTAKQAHEHGQTDTGEARKHGGPQERKEEHHEGH
ncbi:MAG: hypothetical protein AMXMBFR13_17700 [Phycisphaerae bacterium]